jgi:hypothetical protein
MNYNKLKIARDVLSKNQDDIANETGRTQTIVSAIETGRRKELPLWYIESHNRKHKSPGNPKIPGCFSKQGPYRGAVSSIYPIFTPPLYGYKLTFVFVNFPFPMSVFAAFPTPLLNMPAIQSRTETILPNNVQSFDVGITRKITSQTKRSIPIPQVNQSCHPPPNGMSFGLTVCGLVNTVSVTDVTVSAIAPSPQATRSRNKNNFFIANDLIVKFIYSIFK